MWSFPDIDPIAFQVGPLAVRWYGLMYLFGFVGGYFVVRWLGRKRGLGLGNEELMELISYVAIGVVLGGRLGYVIFYNLSYYLAYPLQLFAVWQGACRFTAACWGRYSRDGGTYTTRACGSIPRRTASLPRRPWASASAGWVTS